MLVLITYDDALEKLQSNVLIMADGYRILFLNASLIIPSVFR